MPFRVRVLLPKIVALLPNRGSSLVPFMLLPCHLHRCHCLKIPLPQIQCAGLNINLPVRWSVKHTYYAFILYQYGKQTSFTATFYLEKQTLLLQCGNVFWLLAWNRTLYREKLLLLECGGVSLKTFHFTYPFGDPQVTQLMMTNGVKQFLLFI